MKRAPLKKRTSRSFRPRLNVDPSRMALAALDRIKSVLVRSGRAARLGPPADAGELDARAKLLGTELPPSYVAAMRVARRIGAPDTLLCADEMTAAAERLATSRGAEARRYVPFGESGDHLVCFDRDASRRAAGAVRHDGELPVVAWSEAGPSLVAAHFGEWLDAVADAREEAVEAAAKMPPRLKRLLTELGFRFDYPVVGHLETGDVAAILELLGPELAREVSGGAGRLFDASGKAALALHVDEFRLTARLGAGELAFEAEDVFRWLRSFRDESFFSDVDASPVRHDTVRDLRLAPPEAPPAAHGVLRALASRAPDLVFCAASGSGPDDLHLLGRASAAGAGPPSVLLHVVGGAVVAARDVSDRLADVHVTASGAVWGLTTTAAVLFGDGPPRAFPLPAPARGRPLWCGIGGAGDRVLVWGRGALLAFDGRGFAPFEPDAMLDESESVVAVHARGLRVWMLVCGDGVGAVASFDSVGWRPIGESQVIAEALVDFDRSDDRCHVLDRRGGLWTIDDDGPPEAVRFASDAPAFVTGAGAPRRLHGVRAVDGETLLASDGGVIALGSGAARFHAIDDRAAAEERSSSRTPVRLVRVGGGPPGAAGRTAAVVALGGPNARIWRPAEGGRAPSFDVIDLGALS